LIFNSFIDVTVYDVVPIQGDSYSNASADINFMIGEAMIKIGTDGTNDLIQGFHQTNWIFAGLEDHSRSYEATIFLNPTSEVLNIRTSTFENVRHILYDTKGKLILQDKLSSEQTTIQVSQLAKGSYSIVLNNHTRNLKIFKLIKIH
jgi:hypothetical protein